MPGTVVVARADLPPLRAERAPRHQRRLRRRLLLNSAALAGWLFDRQAHGRATGRVRGYHRRLRIESSSLKLDSDLLKLDSDLLKLDTDLLKLDSDLLKLDSRDPPSWRV